MPPRWPPPPPRALWMLLEESHFFIFFFNLTPKCCLLLQPPLLLRPPPQTHTRAHPIATHLGAQVRLVRQNAFKRNLQTWSRSCTRLNSQNIQYFLFPFFSFSWEQRALIVSLAPNIWWVIKALTSPISHALSKKWRKKKEKLPVYIV